MFSIEKYNEKADYKILEHSNKVFHEALLGGERTYHVHNPKGEDYDITYKGNMEWHKGIIPEYAGRLLPEYLNYDEYDRDSIDTEFLNSFSQYICYSLTEYSIAIARAVLMYTDKPVYCMDSRMLWFIMPQDRLHIGVIPEEDDKTIALVGAVGHTFNPDDTDIKKSDIFTFHSAFYIQEMLHGKNFRQMKYLQYPMADVPMGIGGILSSTCRFKKFAEQLGLQLAYDYDNIGKFRVSELKDYFNINFKRDDSSDDNTLWSDSMRELFVTWRFNNIKADIDKRILTDDFRNNLDEYTDAIIGNHRTLGVIIRGTDYKSTGIDKKIGKRQGTVEELSPAIKKWLDDYGYEKIILATEDQNILNQMRECFGNKVIAIAQERHTVSEFRQGQAINDLEKETYSKEEYDSRVMDTNINYFYALYALSKCNALLSSGQNNGWDTVVAMNDNGFEREARYGLDDL